MKRILFVLVGLLGIAVWCLYVSHNLCRGYSCLTFENKQKFAETKKIEDTNTSYKGVLTKGTIQIRIEVYSALSQEMATQFTQTKIVLLQGLFENARSPYPGALSNEIVCENRFKPIIKEINLNGIKTTIITGYLNNRLQYGGCLDDQLSYVGETAMLYCENQKKWYYFEVITKKPTTSQNSETTHLIQSLRCQKPF